jgi:3-deoxy-D-manno-octulosonic-acid transferase
MRTFVKFKRRFLLNKDFFLKIKKIHTETERKRFWFYAESLGEFRLALCISDIISAVFAEKSEPDPIFFISFKTFSTLSLAEKNENGRTFYFFHPFLGFKTVFKKYILAVKPDYFISVQHPVSKKFVSELLNSGLNTKIIFAGMSGEDLKKIKLNPAEPFGRRLKDLPLPLKYITCFECAVGGGGGGGGGGVGGGGIGAGHTGKNIVISFVSIHKKETVFIFKLIKEIISGGITPENSNLKFIFVPRNIKNSGKIYKISLKSGIEPVYYESGKNSEDGNCGECGNLRKFLETGGIKSMVVAEYGALNAIYPVSDIVYVGKSLFESEKGGHNVLEPASYGKPVITGNYAVNFKDIIGEMLECSAITVAGEKNFKEILNRFIADESLRNEYGRNGLNFCHNKKEEFKTYFKNYIKEIIAP